MVEVLIYIAGLLAIVSVLILITIQFFNLYKEVVIVPRVDRVGVSLVDRIGKEIRNADQIDVFTSKFEIPEGELNFTTIENSSLINKKFYLENSQIKFKEGNNTAVVLTPKNIQVQNFNLTFLASPVSEAVRFTIEIEFKTRDTIETKTYTGFAILRESYE